MPYIKEADRIRIEPTAVGDTPATPGELNYIITAYCSLYLRDKGLSYATVNEIVGVLECAKLELYRRVAAPYEDKKIAENGDVYPPEVL